MATRARAVSDQDKERRREVILGSAKRVFARKGYHATTIAEVAKAARISYGSVYWYFDSKDALFHALMDTEELALRRSIDAALSALPATAGSEQVLRAAVQATFEFFEADRDAVRLLFRDAGLLGPRFDRHLAGIYERFIGDIEATVESAQAAGDLIRAPARMVAFSIAALVSQLAVRRLSTDDGVPARVFADFVVTLLLDGLRPRNEDGVRRRDDNGLRPGKEKA